MFAFKCILFIFLTLTVVGWVIIFIWGMFDSDVDKMIDCIPTFKF